MTSLLQKINDLHVRVDNVSTSGGGGTTDTTALQAQIDTNTTDISGIQTNKQDKLTAGNNITIVDNVISSTGGGSTTETVKVDVGFLAYHNTTTNRGAIQNLPYNILKYNNGSGYDVNNYIFTAPVAGNYYFYATYFTVVGSRGVVDLMRIKSGQPEEILGRSQEGQVNPADNEKRIISVVINCNVGDQLFARVRFNVVRLSPENYSATDDIIYGPYGCQLIPSDVNTSSTSNTVGFLAFHNSALEYGAVQKLPYNIIKYNTGGGYDNSTYTFTAPVAGKYYFYAIYFTGPGQKAVVDIMLKKIGQTEQIMARSQEGTNVPGTHEKREISVVVECDINDELYVLVQSASVKLAPGTYADDNTIIYGPFGCQLLT